MAENKPSKSTKRAQRNKTTGKTSGPVRTHNPKASTALRMKPNEDILSAVRNDRRSMVVDATNQVVVRCPLTIDQLNEFGAIIVMTKERLGWANKAHNSLVCDYIKSLCNGVGMAPSGLGHSSVRTVQRAFMNFCDKREIRYDVHQPAQVS